MEQTLSNLLFFNSLTDIDKVLKKLKESIKENGQASLYEYYKLIGAVTLEEDSKYGWTDLLGCRIVICRCGYELSLPNPKILKENPMQDLYNILNDVHEDNFEDAVQDAFDIVQRNL